MQRSVRESCISTRPSLYQSELRRLPHLPLFTSIVIHLPSFVEHFPSHADDTARSSNRHATVFLAGSRTVTGGGVHANERTSGHVGPGRRRAVLERLSRARREYIQMLRRTLSSTCRFAHRRPQYIRRSIATQDCEHPKRNRLRVTQTSKSLASD